MKEKKPPHLKEGETVKNQKEKLQKLDVQVSLLVLYLNLFGSQKPSNLILRKPCLKSMSGIKAFLS